VLGGVKFTKSLNLTNVYPNNKNNNNNNNKVKSKPIELRSLVKKNTKKIKDGEGGQGGQAGGMVFGMSGM
jgi:hypothetical protein